MWIDDVLQFWFQELKPRDWFEKNDEIDRRIRERFATLHADLTREAIAIPDTARGHLAAVIVLDQFSRNMFRNSPDAYAADERALRLADRALELGFDRQLTPDERRFLYMPFMHAEDPAAQARCVELFTSLADPVSLDYAIEHRDIVDRFGRFPHRNAVLQRASTPEELEFLKGHKGF